MPTVGPAFFTEHFGHPEPSSASLVPQYMQKTGSYERRFSGSAFLASSTGSALFGSGAGAIFTCGAGSILLSSGMLSMYPFGGNLRPPSSGTLFVPVASGTLPFTGIGSVFRSSIAGCILGVGVGAASTFLVSAACLAPHHLSDLGDIDALIVHITGDISDQLLDILYALRFLRLVRPLPAEKVHADRS